MQRSAFAPPQTAHAPDPRVLRPVRQVALAGLAVVFSAIREWRSSTYAGMAAHALHNGVLVTLMVVGMG